MNHNSNDKQLKILNYLIYKDECLGKGSNGFVYKGLDTQTNQLVAIKEINLVRTGKYIGTNQPDCLKIFKHPNILSYRHHFTANHFFYLVTELCQQTLLQRIKRKGKIDQESALDIFIQLLDAYQQIRKMGLLHRDLKPENIFLKGNTPKIGDFEFTVKTRSKQIKDTVNVGSPLYMSPQALEHSIYSQKSDVWSLGLILYQMVHGNIPFTSKSEQALIRQLKRPILHFNCHPELISIFKNIFTFSQQNRISAKTLKIRIKQYALKLSASNRQIKKQTIIENEINYLKLMEYIKIIAGRCKNGFKYQYIQYLLEFNIRMRMNFLQSQYATDAQQLCEFKKKHSFPLVLPTTLGQTDRLRFFSPTSAEFKVQLLWQTQAQLKDTIGCLLSKLAQIDSEQKAVRWEQEMRLTDFLLTVFVFNRNLIQTDNGPQSFSHLKTILSSPHCLNLTVCRQILRKGRDLKIH